MHTPFHLEAEDMIPVHLGSGRIKQIHVKFHPHELIVNHLNHAQKSKKATLLATS